MNSSRVLRSLFIAFLLAGCGGIQSLVPDQSTLADVRVQVGQPTDIRFDADGNELWEYAGGAMGEQAYLVRARKDGRVIDVVELLTQARFDKVAPRVSTKAQVRELLGKPFEQNYFRGEAVWSWRTRLGAQSGYYVVKFNTGGVVIEAGMMVDPSSDGDSRGSGRGGGS